MIRSAASSSRRPVRGAAGILDVATATLPVVALLNLAAASDVPSALLTGGVLVLLAAALARWHRAVTG